MFRSIFSAVVFGAALAATAALAEIELKFATDSVKNEIWLGFLDTYRTMCIAPEPGFRKLLQEVQEFDAAA